MDPLDWQIIPQIRYEGPILKTHSRNVFISTASFEGSTWVAKLEKCERRLNQLSSFPHAEEIAYKVGKLFGWNTVPKSKVLHQQDTQESKYQKYLPLMNSFLISRSEYTHTFTFQKYIKGETLPDSGSKAIFPNIEAASFQKAFLFNIIIGKGDARGDNCVCEMKTNELYEIDNEYMGYPEYVGILNNYKELKTKEIALEILNEFIKVRHEDLLEIKNKYMQKDLHLYSLLKIEPSFEIPCQLLEESLQKRWDVIFSNLAFLKNAVETLTSQHQLVNIKSLEDCIKNLRVKK